MRKILFVLLVATGCATPSSLYYTSSPLVGSIWDVKESRTIPMEELERRALRADYLLLGEKHDNPRHHELQARLFHYVALRKRVHQIVFEQINEDQEQTITGNETPSALRTSLDWERSGWPDWKFYEPIFKTALDRRVKIRGGNWSKNSIRKMMSQGLKSLPRRFLAKSRLNRRLPRPMFQKLRNEIVEGHCGHAPAGHVNRMIEVQRARDAKMATVLSEKKTGVLVAGNGHVHNDWAVGLMMRGLRSRAKVMSVGILEVSGEGVREPAKHLPYDYVIYTGAVTDQDPCERFRKQLEKMKKNST